MFLTAFNVFFLVQCSKFVLFVVLYSETDAQMCIYDASCDTHFGFCCDIDEEASRQLSRT